MSDPVKVFLVVVLVGFALLLGVMIGEKWHPTESDWAAAPEAAPIPDPWPSELPDHGRSIKFYSGFGNPPEGFFDEPPPVPVDPIKDAERAELVRVLQAVVDADDLDPEKRDQLISDLFRGKISSCKGWTRLEQARKKPEPPRPDEPAVINLDLDPSTASDEIEPLFVTYDQSRAWIVISFGGKRFKLTTEQADTLEQHLQRFRPHPAPDERRPDPIAIRPAKKWKFTTPWRSCEVCEGRGYQDKADPDHLCGHCYGGGAIRSVKDAEDAPWHPDFKMGRETLQPDPSSKSKVGEYIESIGGFPPVPPVPLQQASAVY